MTHISDDITDRADNSAPSVVREVSDLDYYKHLASVAMFNTRGARFMASQLLVMKERASLMILSVLTVFLIAISIALLGTPEALDTSTTRQLGVLSAVASVAILAITLFDYALGRGLLAARLHDNSLKITEIMREVEREFAKQSPSIATLERCARRYERANVSTGVNHSSVDFALFKISRKTSTWAIVNLFYRLFSMSAQACVVSLSVLPGLVTLLIVVYYASRLASWK